jgi:uncharacterized membrane protein YkvA (DUF1232 family)
METCIENGHAQPQRSGLGANLAANLKKQSKFFLEQLQIICRAVRHPGVPWYAKLVAACSVCYVFSPIQLIPNFIPVIGQLDDVLVITLGLKLLRKWVPSEVLKQCDTKPRAGALARDVDDPPMPGTVAEAHDEKCARRDTET